VPPPHGQEPGTSGLATTGLSGSDLVMEIPIHKYGNLTGTLRAQTNGIVSSKKSQEKQDSNTFPGDSATLSFDAKLLTARASVARVAFEAGEKAAGEPTEEMLLTAGKEQALEFMQFPAELTPMNTANHIVGGITGYIYNAFRLNNPQAIKEDLAEFQKAVLEGFEEGLQELRKPLTDETTLNFVILEDIREIEQIVRKQLPISFEQVEGQFEA